MSKMSELNRLVQELKKCGESLVNIADELAEIFSETGKKKTEAPTESAKEYTFTEVRAFLAEKSRAGHTAEIRKILEAHGADKLSALDKGEYAAVMAEAEVLNNGKARVFIGIIQPQMAGMPAFGKTVRGAGRQGQPLRAAGYRLP